MTPRKILLFGLYIVAIVFVISLVFPKDGLKIGTYTVYFPDYRTCFQVNTSKTYKDIGNIITSVDTTDYGVDTSDYKINLPAITDTLQMTIAVKDSATIKSDSLQQIIIPFDPFSYIQPFEFPPGQEKLLLPFFHTLNNLSQRNKPVRILHYGDSQIEVDNITATIRNYMQKYFGGQGVGFIPIVPATDASVTFQQNLSANWKRFSVLDKKSDSLVLGKRFGITGSLSRYVAGNISDTLAYIGLKPVYIGYRNTRTFSRARLFYGKSDTPFTIVINHSDKQLLHTDNIVSSAWWRFGTRLSSLELQLQGRSLPDIYGIALDGPQGVAVDNIPMRGSSGLDFTRMDTAQMGQMFRMMDVEMLLLQFGVNVVPNVTDSYGFYTRSLSRQLNTLKALKPGITIIVIGVNDVSQNTKDGYRSYPNITKIRDAQKEAAFNTGCIFWDLYEAMGGENSMPSWVAADPPLAQKDYVHFTHGGAKIIAELFCKAWAKEYQEMTKQPEIEQ